MFFFHLVLALIAVHRTGKTAVTLRREFKHVGTPTSYVYVPLLIVLKLNTFVAKRQKYISLRLSF